MSTVLTRTTWSEAETWLIEATARNADLTAMDITGATIEWKLGRRIADGTDSVVHTASVGSGITIVGASTGRFDIRIHPTGVSGHSAVSPRRDYYQECRVTLTTGDVSLQFEGPVTIADSIFII